MVNVIYVLPPLIVFLGFPVYISLIHSSRRAAPLPQAPVEHQPIHPPRVIFIDFGANCGNSFEHFSKHLLQTKKLTITDAYLFEPQPQVFMQWLVPMRERLGNHVRIYNAAISNNDQNVTFFIDSLYASSICTMDKGYPHGASSLHQHISGPDFEEVHIQSVDAAAFMRGIRIQPGDFVLMKIDIEAHEYSVIRHLIVNNVLCNHVDELWVEWHDLPTNVALDRQGLQQSLEWILTECVLSFNEWTL